MKLMTLGAETKERPIVEAQLEVLPAASQDASMSSLVDIDEKRLIRRIDFILIPWLGLLYILSFLDRTGIGNARVGVFLLQVFTKR